jgi:hypothetical protein
MINRIAILLSLLVPLATNGQTNTNLERKMEEIIIPNIEFREANPIDVLNFLTDANTASSPDISSLSMISTSTPTTRVFYTYETEDGSPLDFKPLTLEYRRITMSEAYNRITKEIGITYRLENSTPVFFTRDGKRIIRKKHVEQAVPDYRRQEASKPDP